MLSVIRKVKRIDLQSRIKLFAGLLSPYFLTALVQVPAILSS